jgi:transmembrane sensor
MERQPTDEDGLWDEALDLAIRLQGDPRNPVTLDLIQRWRHRSPAHEAAWREVTEIHHLSGQALAAQARPAQPRFSRRMMVAGGASAMAAGLAVLAAPTVLLHARADHMTGTAELRTLLLPDGSEATLGPDSALRLGFTPAVRSVELMAGMAYFRVKPDPARPFGVTTGSLTARALGTAYEVRSEAEALTVAVTEGRVAVSLADAAAGSTHELGAGDWLAFDPSTARTLRGRREIGQLATWRDRLILADGDTIANVVDRIAHWKTGQVLIADPSFGRQRVSGVFDLTKPLEALEAVVAPHGGKVRTLSPYLTVVTRF